MAMFLVTMTERLQGLIFHNAHIISATSADPAIVLEAFLPVFEARRAIQTPDVEYISAIATEVNSTNENSVYLNLPSTNGSYDGHTAPPSNFLLCMLSTIGYRPSRIAIRGFAVTELTENGIFNVGSGGDSDQLEADSGNATDTLTDPYGGLIAAYLLSVKTNCYHRPGYVNYASYSSRVTIGNKQVKRTI